jgi:hypothetical protein
MAVYREGYSFIEFLQRNSIDIYPGESCDNGVPVKKGDSVWNQCKYVIDFYGRDNKGTRQENRYSTGRSVSQCITLIDEWAVSDERKTVTEATDVFRIEFVSCTDGKCKGYDGYITFSKIN